MKQHKIIFFALALFLFQSVFAQSEWKVDKSHSKIQFEVSHMVISSVTGFFKKYDIQIETTQDDFSDAKISFTADVNSIDTDNEKRDKHLKSADFFDAENHPQIKFKSKSFEKTEEGKYKLVGDITMRGITKEISLDVKYKGTVTDPWGSTRAGFVITGEINRFEFGLNWNKLIEAGGAVVGKTVEITCVLELKKKKEK